MNELLKFVERLDRSSAAPEGALERGLGLLSRAENPPPPPPPGPVPPAPGPARASLETLARAAHSGKQYRNVQTVHWPRRQEAEVPPIRVSGRRPPARGDFLLALAESLAGEYQRQNRHAEALQALWEAFTLRPSAKAYRALRRAAEKAGSAKDWAGRAEAHLRTTAEGNALLVRLLLEERRFEEAWEDARARGCADAEWVELAEWREKEQAEDALKIYGSCVERLLAPDDPDSTAWAIRLLRRLRRLALRLGKGPEFAFFLDTLRDRYRRRPHLLALLCLLPGS